MIALIRKPRSNVTNESTRSPALLLVLPTRLEMVNRFPSIPIPAIDTNTKPKKNSMMSLGSCGFIMTENNISRQGEKEIERGKETIYETIYDIRRRSTARFFTKNYEFVLIKYLR